MKEFKNFISVDWGTTNFRLRLVDYSSLKVIEDIQNDFGVRRLYQQFIETDSISQETYFLQFLKNEASQLKGYNIDIPIVISGMASSNIGLKELAYAETPIFRDGKHMVINSICSKDYGEIILISGAKTKDNVMRGEETQALGIMDKMNSDGLLILPGTHSKHILISEHRIIDFKTYMTGELFELLSKVSILKNSISHSDWNAEARTYFRKGLEKGFANTLTEHFFFIRANHILKTTTKEQNYFYLSGLLIGDELSALKEYSKTIYLATSEKIAHLYTLALQELLDSTEIIVFDEKTVIETLLIGQKKILKHHGA